jgi:hypothetical protein
MFYLVPPVPSVSVKSAGGGQVWAQEGSFIVVLEVEIVQANAGLAIFIHP